VCCASAGADRVSELPDTAEFLDQLRGLIDAETSQSNGELGFAHPSCIFSLYCLI